MPVNGLFGARILFLGEVGGQCLIVSLLEFCAWGGMARAFAEVSFAFTGIAGGSPALSEAKTVYELTQALQFGYDILPEGDRSFKSDWAMNGSFSLRSVRASRPRSQ